LIAGSGSSVFVRAGNIASLQKELDKTRYKYEKSGKGLVVSGATTDDIGKLAYSSKIPVLELASHSASLEQAFLELTEGAAEYEAHTKGVKQ
jgi:ABC-2 type transport system ATP-binding protein